MPDRQMGISQHLKANYRENESCYEEQSPECCRLIKEKYAD